MTEETKTKTVQTAAVRKQETDFDAIKNRKQDMNFFNESWVEECEINKKFKAAGEEPPEKEFMFYFKGLDEPETMLEGLKVTPKDKVLQLLREIFLAHFNRKVSKAKSKESMLKTWEHSVSFLKAISR